MPTEDSWIQKVFKSTLGVMLDEEDNLLLIGPHGEVVTLTCDESTGWLDVDWVALTEN